MGSYLSKINILMPRLEHDIKMSEKVVRGSGSI